MEITEKTKELLAECKKAGYERVTIFIADKRVPCSVKIRRDSTGRGLNDNGLNENGVFIPKTSLHYTGEYWGANETEPVEVIGAKSPQVIGQIICADPPCREREHPDLPGESWPAIWGIIKRLGLSFVGGGSSDGHNVKPALCGILTPGYYETQQSKPKPPE